MKTILPKLLLCLGLLFLLGCNTARKAWVKEEEQGWQKRQLPDSVSLRNTIFLLGGMSAWKAESENPVLPMLEKELAAAGEKSTVIFLGDNVPSVNLSNEKSRHNAENYLLSQLEVLKNFEGKTYFLGGEKDWNNGKPNGREALRWQEKFIEDRIGKKVFMPGKACGEPEKEKLHDDLRLLFVDSQWWLQDWENIDGINKNCEISDRLAMLQEVENVLKKYDKERVLLLMHHPLFSNGIHGGSFAWKHHLFPLTIWKKNAWLPLPGIGSLAVLARQAGASRQDVTHVRYLRLREELLKIAERSPRNQSLIFVSAHDQSLQYFEHPTGRLQFVVSGSGGGAGFARSGRQARFVHARQGFAKLYCYENNEIWLEFLTPGEGRGEALVCFRKKLFDGVPIPKDLPPAPDAETLPDSVTVSASSFYEAGELRKITFGNRYRAAWDAGVTVPVFNLEAQFSHLTPVQQGGGMSSKSLRLEGPDGKEYVLRSVNKNVAKGLPKELRRTIVQDFIQDFKSGSHPYGAFVIPPLADAAGIYHTNPRLFYLPAQRRLGAYNENFAEELYLFEERPDDDWNDLESFGNSRNIISYLDLLEKIHESPKHRVDQAWALRSRLFDQWINDYDRHDDQWRWASFPQGDSLTVYRPIPRDRDQAFFDLRGLVPFVISRKFLALQQRGFRGKIFDVPGQAYPGQVFDRSFLNELDREDWLAVAQNMKTSLPDSVIENAFKIWPSEIYRLTAPQIIKTLKQRRDRIPIHAEKLYRFQARHVDVVGTNKRDFFEVKNSISGSVEVSVFSMKKNGERGQRFYHRIFLKNETREIRLFGLGGDDLFRLTGEGRQSIAVRIVGGEDGDRVEDQLKPGGFFKKTTVYDTPEGMNIDGKLRDRRANELKINEYDRHEFKYNRYFPLVTFGRTVDDGLLLGGGVRLTYYRFRKEPYGIQHRFFTRFSANTNALNLHYTGDFTRIIGPLDFNPDLRFDRPVIFNFFGMGNDTKDSAEGSQFNWVRLEKLSISPLLKKSWYNGRNFTRFGPFFEHVEVENRAGRITDTDIFSPSDLEEKSFLGFTVQHVFQFLDNASVPRNGIRFKIGATHYHNLNDNQGYTQLAGSFTTYVTFGDPVEFTLATRIGGATFTNQNFLFYHNNSLGGNNYLRGYRNNRFAGKSLFYQNSDLRIKLFYLRNRFMPFEFGVMGGFDYGRVWVDGEESGRLHAGYSPGLWFTPYKFAAVTAFYTFANAGENDTYTIRIGFFF